MRCRVAQHSLSSVLFPTNCQGIGAQLLEAYCNGQVEAHGFHLSATRARERIAGGLTYAMVRRRRILG